MKTFLLITSLLLGVASVANAADGYRLVEGDGNKILILTTGSQGSAHELYDLLLKAGVPSRRQGEDNEVAGQKIKARLSYLAGARYTGTLEFDNGAASVSVRSDSAGKTTVTIQGDTAKELAGVLAAAQATSDSKYFSCAASGDTCDIALAH